MTRQERLDLFAAHALSGLLAHAGNAHQDLVVAEAVTLAEEMIEELERRAPPASKPVAKKQPIAKKKPSR